MIGGPEKGRFLLGGQMDCLGLSLFGLLGQEDSLNVGQHTTLGDGDTREKFVQLFVVANGQLKMAGDDSGLLVVTGSVASQLEDFSSQVLENGSKVHGSTSSNALGIVAFAQKTMDTPNGELKSSSGRPGLRLGLCLSSLSASRHVSKSLRSNKYESKSWSAM